MVATVLEMVARDHSMTIELMEDQGHITWKTVHQIHHDVVRQEEDLHKVHCVQS
jgi:hypothetical protein